MRKLVGIPIAVLSGLATAFVGLTFFNNCSPSFQTKELAIRTSCTTAKKVTPEEFYQTLRANHKGTGDSPYVRCPGFLAVLKEDQDPLDKEGGSTNFKLQSGSTLSNCGETLPPEKEPVVTDPTVEKNELIKSLIAKTSATEINNWAQKLSDGSLWPTRFHASGYSRTVPEWIKSEFQMLAAQRSDIQIRLFEHTNTVMPSVEVIIPGTGPNKDEFVIIGGHQDSINSTSTQNSRTNPNSRSPGADDNASGVAVLLETFKVLAQNNFKPNRTLVFYTYSAEEVGLVGSQEVARAYKQAAKKVSGVMQVDMALYPPANKNDLYFVTDYTSQNLTTLAADLARQHIGMNIKYMKCGYGCSDHAAWSGQGFPSFMPSEMDLTAAANQNLPVITRIHTTNDIVDSSTDSSYAVKFSQLAIAFAIAMAK